MGYGLCSGDFKLAMNKFTGLVHPHLALVMCIFGSVSNVLCIIVLSRKRMVSPTSTILVGLAVSDLLVLMAYMCIAIMQETSGDKVEYGLSGTSKSYSLSAYTLFSNIFNKVMHAVSIWLTVTLAVWRYLVVCWPSRCKEWCSQTRAKWTVVSVFVTVAILHTPYHYIYQIKPRGSYYGNYYAPLMNNDVTHEFGVTVIATFYITAILMKLVPCVMLAILTLRLVWTLVEAKRRRRDILRNITEVDRKMERTTRMVVVVLFVFLVAEFPGGILTLLVAIRGFGYFNDCYHYMTRILNVTVLLVSAINFVLYCTMSKEFRDTFRQLFVPKRVYSLGTSTSWIRKRLNRAQDVDGAIGSTDSPSIVTISCSPCDNGPCSEHKRG